MPGYLFGVSLYFTLFSFCLEFVTPINLHDITFCVSGIQCTVSVQYNGIVCFDFKLM